MAIACDLETLAVRKPANITAISRTFSTLDCDEPCNATITVTWQNTGGRNGSFEPAIIINGVRNGSGLNQSIQPSQTYQYTFTLSNLVEGTYTVCPDPN